MNTLTSIADFRPHSENVVTPQPALPDVPADLLAIKVRLESEPFEELTVEYDMHERIV